MRQFAYHYDGGYAESISISKKKKKINNVTM